MAKVRQHKFIRNSRRDGEAFEIGMFDAWILTFLNSFVCKKISYLIGTEYSYVQIVLDLKLKFI